MTLPSYTTPECQDVRAHLDSYLSGELLVETTETVQAHLARCASCQAELDRRTALLARLRAAMADAAGPRDDNQLRRLEGAILASLDNRPPLWRRAAFWGAMAASLLLVAALWRGAVPPTPDDATRAVAQGEPVPGGAPSVMPNPDTAASRVQTIDASLYADTAVSHDYCALRRAMPETPPSATAAARLLDAYWGLPAAISPDLAGHTVVDAHVCRNGEREFGHVILQKAGRTSSVFVTEKTAGNLPPDDSRLPAPGADLHFRQEGEFAISAVETARHVGMVVEDAGRVSAGAETASLANAALARDLTEYLKQLARE